jgi:hypothetical protein
MTRGEPDIPSIDTPVSMQSDPPANAHERSIPADGSAQGEREPGPRPTSSCSPCEQSAHIRVVGINTGLTGATDVVAQFAKNRARRGSRTGGAGGLLER